MRQELITEDELMSQLRQGVESLAEVKAAYMEADGSIGIIADASQNRPAPEQQAQPREPSL